jgi:hypothetical protein
LTFKKVESERLLIGEYHNFFRAAQSGDMFTVSVLLRVAIYYRYIAGICN